MKLSDEDFLQVIKNIPLIAIDILLIFDNKIYLSKRTEEPAKNTYFVPGGRIFKNEKIFDAFNRILKDECGFSEDYDFMSMDFLGIYEHFYDTNVFEEENVSTHYVIIAFILNLNKELQNSNFKSFPIDNISNVDEIHSYVKDYCLHIRMKNLNKNK